jgi:hypothetical protein
VRRTWVWPVYQVISPMPSKLKTMNVRFSDSVQKRLEAYAVEPYTKHSLVVAAVVRALELWDEDPSNLLEAYRAVRRSKGVTDAPVSSRAFGGSLPSLEDDEASPVSSEGIVEDEVDLVLASIPSSVSDSPSLVVSVSGVSVSSSDETTLPSSHNGPPGGGGGISQEELDALFT